MTHELVCEMNLSLLIFVVVYIVAINSFIYKYNSFY